MNINQEFKSLIPDLTAEEFSQLEENLKRDGCRDPLVIWKETLIDGHNRFEICSKNKIEFKTFEVEFESKDEAKIWIINNQFGRRNLQPFQRCELALVLEPILKRKADEIKSQAASLRQNKIRDLSNKLNNGELSHLDKILAQGNLKELKGEEIKADKIDKSSVYFIRSGDLVKIGSSRMPEERLRQIKAHNCDAILLGYVEGGLYLENQLHVRYSQHSKNGEWFDYKAIETEINQILSGVADFCDPTPYYVREKMAKDANVSHDTIHKVRLILEKAPEKAKEDLRRGAVSINQVYQDIKREEVREERVKNIVHKSQGNKELKTDKKYPVILCDPPWEYDFEKSANREIENHYPTMKLQDITELPVEDLATPDAVLFLWTTSPKLVEGLEVLHQWGFNYRTCMVWVKDKIGMGYYARQRHELLLIGVKGDMPCPQPENRPDSVIEAARGVHSKKPEIVYSLLEKMYPEFGKIELFSRSKREGWEAWGNEI